LTEEIQAGSEQNQEQPVEAERPEWLPEKFESAEALAKSYSELENKLREQGEEKNNLTAQLEDLYGRVQTMEQSAQQARYDPSADPTLLAYEQAMENGDYRAALAIQVGLAQKIAEQSVVAGAGTATKPDDEALFAYVVTKTAAETIGQGEWDAYKEKIGDAVKAKDFRNLSVPDATEELVAAYERIKFRELNNQHQTLAEQQAERERQVKIEAQTMSGSSGRQPEPTRDEAAINRILGAAKEGSYDALIGG
jgi:hypothetical protein